MRLLTTGLPRAMIVIAVAGTELAVNQNAHVLESDGRVRLPLG